MNFVASPIQINVFTKQEQTQIQKVNLWLQREGSGGGIHWDMGINPYILLYIK